MSGANEVSPGTAGVPKSQVMTSDIVENKLRKIGEYPAESEGECGEVIPSKFYQAPSLYELAQPDRDGRSIARIKNSDDTFYQIGPDVFAGSDGFGGMFLISKMSSDKFHLSGSEIERLAELIANR